MMTKATRRKKGHKTKKQTLNTASNRRAAAENKGVARGGKRAVIAERNKVAADEKAKRDEKKARAVDAMLGVLKTIAQEINVRLEKASKLEGDADDHRLAAAIKLEDARRRCKAAKIKFQTWVEANVDKSYDEVMRLVKIGAAPEPRKALEDLRSGAAARNRKMRKHQRASRDASSGGGKPASPYTTAREAVLALPDKDALELAKETVHPLGLNVVSETDVKRLLELEDDQRKPTASLKSVKMAFLGLKARDKMRLVEFAAEQVGVEIKGDYQPDITKMPEHLRREV